MECRLLLLRNMSSWLRGGTDAGLLAVRLGIGTVLLVFGTEKLVHPDGWLVFVPEWLHAGLRELVGADVGRFVRFQGFVEAALGAQILLGIATRSAAVIAAVLLACIIVTLGLNPLAIRDVAVFASAAAVALAGPGRLSVDAWRALPRASAIAPHALWVVTQIAVGVLFLGVPGSTSSLGQTRTAARFAHEPIPPVPRALAFDRAKADLGRLLFNEPRLSRNNTIACSTCHSGEAGGADGRVVSIGVDGTLGNRNAPTVLNAALNPTQFWDGRATTLEEQAAGPITNPLEMGSRWEDVVAKLEGDPRYVRLFARSYGDGITPATICHAIAEFERSLITPDAPFDRFVRGEIDALSAAQRRGFARFKAVGCIACHQGVNVGGTLFHAIGHMQRVGERSADVGRFAVTSREEDRRRFRVPPLRNVALTAPYFHDGSVATLDDAVRVMAWSQLGYELDETDRRDIVAFLESLTGNVPPI